MPSLGKVKRRRKEDPDSPRVSKKRSTVGTSCGETTEFQEQEPKTRPLSRLENLPTEVLELIYIEEPNVAVLLASPHIYAKLNSTYIKKELVLQYLSAGQRIEDPKAKNVPEKKFPLNGHKEEELAWAQSCVLGKPWLTYPFLRQCQLDYFLDTATKALRLFLRDQSDAVTKEQLAQLEEMIRRYHGRFTTHFAEKLLPDTESYVFKLSNEETFRCWFHAYYHTDCSIMHVRTTRQSADPFEPRPEKQQSKFMLPSVRAQSKLPAALLGLPWTQDNADMVGLLVTSQRMFRPYGQSLGDFFDHEVLDEAISSAVEQNSMHAVAILTSCPATFQSVLSGMLPAERDRFEAAFYIESQYSWYGSPVVIDDEDWAQVHGPLLGNGPVRLIKGPHFVKYDYNHPRWLGPDQTPFLHIEHIILALKVAVANHDDGFQLFKFLAYAKLFGSHTIDILPELLEALTEDPDPKSEEEYNTRSKAFIWLTRQQTGCLESDDDSE